ncbi:hypothetical protein F5141DRAFT_1294254 [Pisolithus sp. B1]|nr:hypothetical protein F5141DRAFT_1294254 [Pisolithus sp. B1]
MSGIIKRPTSFKAGVTGCTWSSAAFSSPNRFLTILVRVSSLVSQHKGEYIWMDAICIDQDSDEDKREQIPHMVKIFRDSAGTIAFGKLTPDDEFSELVYTYDTEDGEKHGLTFGLSGCRITKNSGSPEKSSSCPLAAPTTLGSICARWAVAEAKARQASSCRSSIDVDKVYGVLGAVDEPLRQLRLDYSVPRSTALLNLMFLMPHGDVLDTLTFNRLPPNRGVHDAENWSGMMDLDEPTEHPSYETDRYMGENARVVRIGDRIFTVVDKASLWSITIPQAEAKSLPVDAATVDQEWTHKGCDEPTWDPRRLLSSTEGP